MRSETATRLVRFAVLAALWIVVLGGCAPASSSTSRDGATLVSTLCVRCHPAERVVAAKKDRAAWTATIERMRAHGLQVDDGQAAAIVTYLTTRDGGQ